MYETTMIETLQEMYDDTGWPTICDGDLQLSYFGAPEDV